MNCKPLRVVELTCKVCGSLFKMKTCWAKRGGKYCSRSCHQKGRVRKARTLIAFHCAECKKQFFRRKGMERGARFCSVSCRAVFQRREIRGENHPSWKGGVSERTHSSRLVIREAIKAKGKCERCGETKNLHGHHIEPWSVQPSQRENPVNIEVLCAKCHALEHPKLSGMLLIPHVRSGQCIHCNTCGAPRYVAPYLLATAKYCSHACQLLALHASLVGRKRSKQLVVSLKESSSFDGRIEQIRQTC